MPDGYELVKTELPVLVTVSNEVGEPRYVSRSKLIGMLRKRISVQKWSGKNLGLDQSMLKTLELVKALPPPDIGRKCVILDGTSPMEKPNKLAEILISLA